MKNPMRAGLALSLLTASSTIQEADKTLYPQDGQIIRVKEITNTLVGRQRDSTMSLYTANFQIKSGISSVSSNEV